MRKLFGSNRYVDIGKDVEPNEEYLQLEVLNIWDLDSSSKKFYKGIFTYIVKLYKRTNNHGSYASTRMVEADLTADEINNINSYLT